MQGKMLKTEGDGEKHWQSEPRKRILVRCSSWFLREMAEPAFGHPEQYS